ncbi:MAG: 50S ribosomal protein L11 methyltransferase [Tissierellia bacterium]|nr:50S ribosomal protein L11 methyltransferase [Tissierellia bacterium]
MKWVEVRINTTTEAEEIVCSIMYDLGVTGLAIEDPNDILAFQQTEENWDFIDPDLINQDYEGVTIKAYFPESEDITDKLDMVRDRIERIPLRETGKSLGQVTVSEVYEKDWSETWKKYYKPVRIGKRIVIKPTWEEYEKEDEDIVIELDPGMAFGTGTHETTILCIEALEKYMNEGALVYDVGCGSGILSVVAARLGARKVIGIDIDELCVKVSKENISINGVEDLVEVRKGNLLDSVNEKADIIVSNIIAEVIINMVPDLKAYINDDGIFIASGIITEKLSSVMDALRNNGFNIVEEKIINDWAVVIAKLE